jgi:hypothetical protein
MPNKQRAVSRRYPAPKAIPHIIARRNLLAQKLIATMVIRQEDEAASDRMMDDIVREYGSPEVARMIGRLLENLRRPDDPEVEAAQLYATYVGTWRRFGAGQPLLSAEEYERLQRERAELIGKQLLKEEKLGPEEQQRLNELSNQIFAEPHLWDDLYPPNPPAEATSPGTLTPPRERPGRNDPCWCGSGRKYKHCHLAEDSAARG